MDKRNILQEEWATLTASRFNRDNKLILNIFQRVGKIRVSLLILHKMKITDKILVTYPDNGIKDSWEEDIIKFEFEKLNITYCNHASLNKYIDQQWNIVINDEVHTIHSEERIKNIQLILDNSKYSLGLTGTLVGNRENELALYFGYKTIIKYNKQDAINDGIVADYEIEVRIVDLDTIIKKKNSKGKLVSEADNYRAYTWLIDKGINKGMLIFTRNRLLQQSLAKQNEIKKCLKEYENLRAIIFTGFNKTAESLNIPYYHSKCKDDSNLIDFNNHKFNHLALAVKGSIGVTYTDLDVVILSNFLTDASKNEQGLTRSSIKDYGDKISKFIIICTNTPTELKKLDKTLIEFDKTKIKYIKN